jgi:heme/copper-type cytochrome/quinol oxidase subunit 2
VVDSGLRREAGCDSRLRARYHRFKAEHTGTFRGHCSELCGKEHAFMPIVVRVVSDATTSLGRWQEKEMAALADDPNKTWTSTS